MSRNSHDGRLKDVALAVFAVVVLAFAGYAVRSHAGGTAAASSQQGLPAVSVSPTPSPVKVSRVVLYGHSMPFGRGASSPSKSYAHLLGEQLHVPVANYAVGGLEFPSVEKIVLDHPVPAPTDLVVLHVGLNDIDLRGTKPSLVTDGAESMSKMIGYLSQRGARVVVMSECHPASWTTAPAPFDKGSDAAFAAWNSMVKRVVAGYRLAVLDTACSTWDTATMTDVSKYHPNDAGHALIARSILALV